MKVKRFVAKDMQEAMLRVKKELGNDAVILHTRKFKEGGIFGLFAKEFFEVTAAIDELPVNLASPAPDGITLPPYPHKIKTNNDLFHSNNIKTEINEVKQLVNQVVEKIEADSRLKSMPKSLKNLYQILIKNEVDQKLARNLINSLADISIGRDLTDENNARDALFRTIQQRLQLVKPIITTDKCQVVALVGPTGVGKTTTIAKLAANFALILKKKVALITIDTYRIAAVEQLKTYADIIGIPIEVVLTPEGLQEAVKKHKDKDLVFIDTAGRSHRNIEQITELKQFFTAFQPDQVYLVLSATTKTKDLDNIVTAYRPLKADKVVITKLDETSSYGAILNLVAKNKLNLSYITIGQNVPQDIEVADPKKIAELFIKETEAC